MKDEYTKKQAGPTYTNRLASVNAALTADRGGRKDVAIPSRMTNATPESLNEARLRNRVQYSKKYEQDKAKAGLPPGYM